MQNIFMYRNNVFPFVNDNNVLNKKIKLKSKLQKVVTQYLFPSCARYKMKEITSHSNVDIINIASQDIGTKNRLLIIHKKLYIFCNVATTKSVDRSQLLKYLCQLFYTYNNNYT